MVPSTRLRRTCRLAAGIAVVLLTAGCSTGIAGSGAQAPARPGDARTVNQLAALLMNVPSNAAANATPFDADHTPSLADFSKGYYGTPTSDHLRALGVLNVAHEGWTAADGNAAEVVLFLFDSADAASTWMITEPDALRDAGALPSTLDGLPAVHGWMFTQYAGGGSQDRRFYAVERRVGMTFNFYTPPGSGPGQAPDWVATQYQRLQ